MKRWLVVPYTKEAESKIDLLSKLEAAFDTSFPTDAIEWWNNLENEIQVGTEIAISIEVRPSSFKIVEVND